VLFAVCLPFLAAPVVALSTRWLGERVAYLAAAVAAACFAAVLTLAGSTGTVSIPWLPAMGVSLTVHVDGLATLLAGLASGVGVLVFVYSRGYMHDEPGLAKYYGTLLVFMGSMIGVAYASNLVVLFVFWELTSVASFLLIGHYSDDADAVAAARKALYLTTSGGLFMLVGFLALSAISGPALGEATWNLAAMLADSESMRQALRAEGLLVPVLLLLGVGVATKSAQVPLHGWLPGAMAAPTPVSAFLHSATMVKAGVYLVGRFRPLLLAQDVGELAAAWSGVFVTLGLLTMLVTAILAVAATDIKELLAYSTASHLGLIVAGFGIGSELGAEAGAFHFLNHALFKATLFLVAGIVAHAAGTRALDELGGLRGALPITAVVAGIAALSMAGIPPFNGFYSKELLFEATYEAAHHAGGVAWLLPAVAVLASVFTVVYSLQFLWIFLGDRPDALEHLHRPGLPTLAPAALLATLAMLVGLRPELAIDAIVQGAFEGAGGEHAMHVGIPTTLKPPVVMSVITVAGGIGAFTVVDRLEAGFRRVLDATAAGHPDRCYRRAVDGLEWGGRETLRIVQTGLVRTYATWALGATSVLALAAFVAGGTALPTPGGPGVGAALVVVMGVAVVAAIAVLRAPSHAAGVLTLSILGMMIAIVFVLARAPDLALTQLVVETLLLIVFLLVIDRLPAFYGGRRLDRRVRDGALSVLVGATVVVSVLTATRSRPDDPITAYLVERAGVPATHGPLLTDFGGGGNVVNVILVDFRAFDTLGEISVVAMAALAVLSLLGRAEVRP
jgi:multicomponent Na+:H+ antiporter subunit A